MLARDVVGENLLTKILHVDDTVVNRKEGWETAVGPGLKLRSSKMSVDPND